MKCRGSAIITRRNFGLAIGAIPVFGFRKLALAAERLTIFAAASLKNALDAIGSVWQGSTSMELAISYAASAALAKQIEHGARADIFFSADQDWMAYLRERDLIKLGSDVESLGSSLVLIAPADSKAIATLTKDFLLASLLSDGRLAMADVRTVPAGKYGKAAL